MDAAATSITTSVATAPTPLGQVMVVAAHNYGRGCVIEPATHPRVQELAQSISSGGRVLQAVAVRTLVKPIKRPCGNLVCCPKDCDTKEVPEHLYEVVFGFRRYVACVIAKKTSLGPGEILIFGVMSDEEAADKSITENLQREDATDYQIAVGFQQYKLLAKIELPDVARRFGVRVATVEKYLRPIERCPKEILDDWRRLGSDVDALNELDRISRIEAQDQAVAQRAMLEEWARFRDRTRGKKERSQRPFGGASKDTPSIPRPMNSAQIRDLRDRIDRSSEFRDTAGWHPLTNEIRAILHEFLRHVAEPRRTEMPLRGDVTAERAERS